MKKVILYIKVFLFLAIIAFLFGFAHHKNTQHQIDDIKVEFIDNQSLFLSTEIVNKLLIQSDPKLLNKSKSLINLHKIENDLRNNKMIENAEVFITPSGRLTTTITQRVPIVRVGDGIESYYIDRLGKRMPLSVNYSVRVPLVTGVTNKKIEKEVFLLVKMIRSDSFYKKQIIGIHHKSNGDYLLSTRIGRHKILLGSIENLDDKLKKLKIFYKKEWESENLKKYKLINLKFKQQVVCSK